MKVIRKFAEFVGYTLCRGERSNEWRCPNKKCGFSVSEDYTCCPYCGQKIKFKEPPKVKMIKVCRRMGEKEECEIPVGCRSVGMGDRV